MTEQEILKDIIKKRNENLPGGFTDPSQSIDSNIAGAQRVDSTSSASVDINAFSNNSVADGNIQFYDDDSLKDERSIQVEQTVIELSGSTPNHKSLGEGGNNSILPPLTQLIPNWGYNDYIKERVNWQKGINVFGTEPGWFYFKIFFHFNTSTGLFGGILKDNGGKYMPGHNCAFKYMRAWADHYQAEAMKSRITSLFRFVNILNNINNNAPWFFQSINGLDKTGIESLNEPWKNNEIEIKCLEESIDMRLTKLMEFYKFAAFDFINYKEIIPENLRKFDMTIVLFGVPIRYLDTHAKINGKEFQARQLNTRTDKGQSSNKMTFKIYTFKNCEFNIASINASTPSEVTNSDPFQMGKHSIKINYQKVFTGIQDGFSGDFVSDLGIIEPSKIIVNSDMSNRLKNMAKAYQIIKNNAVYFNAADDMSGYLGKGFNKFWNFSKNMGIGNAYKALIDETEMVCQDYYNSVTSNLVNYGLNKWMKETEMGSIIPPEYGFGTDYYKSELKKLHDGVSFNDIGSTQYNIGTDYYDDYLQKLHRGTNIAGEENKNSTMNPYYVIGTTMPHRGTPPPTKAPVGLNGTIDYSLFDENVTHTPAINQTAMPISNNPSYQPDMPGGPNTNPTAPPIRNKSAIDNPWDNTIHTGIDPTKKLLEEQLKREEHERLREKLFGNYDNQMGINTPYYKRKLRDLHFGTIDQRQTDNLHKEFNSPNW